uniref:Uncharacterized protein n=1 Tax=viral metagenome TaxID=1070528 RepID=A0A6C0M130_9ZZZZ
MDIKKIEREIEVSAYRIVNSDSIAHIMSVCGIRDARDGELCLVSFVDYLLSNKHRIANNVLATARDYSLGSYSYGAYFGETHLDPCIVLNDDRGAMYPVVVCLMNDSGRFIVVDDRTER